MDDKKDGQIPEEEEEKWREHLEKYSKKKSK